MKDWCLGAPSQLAWRANLAQKRAVPDASSPSEVGERVDPSSRGNAGRDRRTGVLVRFVFENGEETWKSANKISFLGHRWDIFCSKSIATWCHRPSKPLPPPPLWVWLGGWEGVTKVRNGVQDEGLAPWGIK